MTAQELEDEDGKKYYTEKFYPYTEPARPNLKPGVVSSKYFDQPLDYKRLISWPHLSYLS